MIIVEVDARMTCDYCTTHERLRLGVEKVGVNVSDDSEQVILRELRDMSRSRGWNQGWDYENDRMSYYCPDCQARRMNQ